MGRVGGLEVKMNSPSVLLLTQIFVTFAGGANAKALQVLPSISTGFASVCTHATFHGSDAASGEFRTVWMFESGFEENAWTGQYEINAQPLGAVNGLDEVTVGEFKQFVATRGLQSQRSMTTCDGGAE